MISREDNLFIVKICKEKIGSFDIYDKDDIRNMFKDILIKLRGKYDVRGMCLIDVYVNDSYGMIMEVNNIYKYGDDIEVKISFHIDSYFFNEIYLLDGELDCDKEIYYYNDKYYCSYDEKIDSKIIYKDGLDIINKGIRIR